MSRRNSLLSLYLSSNPYTTGARRRHVVHQNAKNLISWILPEANSTVVGSVAKSSVRGIGLGVRSMTSGSEVGVGSLVLVGMKTLDVFTQHLLHS